MSATFELLYTTLASKHVFLGIMLCMVLTKFFLLATCIRFSFKTSTRRLLLLFLIVFLAGSCLNDLLSLLLFIKRSIIGITGVSYPPLTFFLRLVWGLYITQYQALALFFEYLLYRRLRFTLWHGLHALINVGISSVFLYHAFFKYHISARDPYTLALELFLIRLTCLYLLFLFIPLFYKVIKRNRQKSPRILKHQLRYLTNFFIPYLFFELFGNTVPYIGTFIPWITDYQDLFYMVSMILCTFPMFFVGRRMLGIRFLNVRKDVTSKEKFNFLSQFKDILEQLHYATALKELAHVNATFFQTAFGLPLGRVRLIIRKINQEKTGSLASLDGTTLYEHIEHFISKPENQPLLRMLTTTKIFIRDEIEFSEFYEDQSDSKEILAFLDHINADIYLPIFERNTIIASIIIERNARQEKLYTNKERDEMLVFTSYVSNIITILKYSNIEALHQHHKQLTEELYHKHQEINQYKESIRSFLRSHKERKIGIVFYKHRRFTFANEAAQELIGMDLNTNLGHSLTQACKSVARRAQEFKTAQTTFTHDSQLNRIIIAGIPSLEEFTTILLVYYPEISDIIKAQFDQLKDPSAWDYILYLETTKSGQLINQLIPGTGEKILNFKVSLLTTALSKKATLIDMPQEDVQATVEIVHQISLRQVLHTLNLTSPEKNNEVALTLFGLNPLLEKESPEPLLLKLDDIGTLYINNIEYLSLETQNYLAEFISCGYFHRFKSDHKILSNVRIICSTTKDLLALVQENTFSKTLYKELQKTSLLLPPLHSFSESEINELAHGYAAQIGTTQTYKNLLALTERDKQKLSADRPLSLREFKERVHQLLVEKSTKHNIAEATHFDPAYDVTEPDIAHAVRLGKKALKDPQLMSILWNKFKNQNKIATLLGVNRSSVNRRCQEYNLK